MKEKILKESCKTETSQDISTALKNIFKDVLQEMMNGEFDSSMGYSKYDKKIEKANYRNGFTKKELKGKSYT